MCFESDVLKTLNGIKTKVQQMKRYIEVEKNQYKKRYTILKQKKSKKYLMQTMTTHQISNVKKVI